MSNLHKIIRFPSVTEKNTDLRLNDNKYVFEVARHATKGSIRRAVQQIFNVNVEAVNTVNVRGKKKRMGRHEGFRPNWKKAIVKIEKGQTIDAFGGV